MYCRVHIQLHQTPPFHLIKIAIHDTGIESTELEPETERTMLLSRDPGPFKLQGYPVREATLGVDSRKLLLRSAIRMIVWCCMLLMWRQKDITYNEP